MKGFQSIWEELRKEGKQIARFPYDKVISFVFRYYPKEKEKTEIKILEVGCGAGNNLWALALEGFDVYGIDGSETAIKLANDIFNKFGTKGNFYIQDFTKPFPFNDEIFDLIIDRGSITCIDIKDAQKTFKEIYRVLKTGGYFFFNPYSTKHFTYLSSTTKKTEKYVLTEKGSIAGTGFVCFYDIQDIEKLLDSNKWEVFEMREVTIEDKINQENLHSEWEVIVKKK
mgnify:CR=1 FL=1